MKRVLLALALLAAPLAAQTPTPTPTRTPTPTVTPTRTPTPTATPTPTPAPVLPAKYSLATQVRPGFGTFTTEATVNKLGDMFYASDARTFGRLAGNTTSTLKYLCQQGTGSISAVPSWCSSSGVTGSGTTNQVAYWTSSSAIGGSANFAFSGTALTLGDTGNLGSTTLQYGNSTFGVSTPEMEITNNNPTSGGFKWNVLALRAQSADQYSGLTLRGTDGREHGAFGYGNASTDAPFLGNTYLEASYFPMSGTNKPPGILFAQTGYMGGSNGSRLRLFFDADGLVHFYKTDGTTKMLSLDTANGYVSVLAGGGFVTSATGNYFGVAGATINTVKNTADHAGWQLDAGGTGKVPFIDFFFSGVKKANVLWDNANTRLTINDQGTNTYLNSGGGTLTLGSAAATVNVPSLGASLNLCTDGSKNLTTSGCAAGGSGTVTSVATTAPITGGTITTTGTIGCATMVASGATHAPGCTPDTAVGAGTTKYLREDASWAVPAGSGTVTSITATAPLTGGTITTTGSIGCGTFVASGGSHAAGCVPDPGASGGTTKYLREDATFAVPSGAGTVTVGTKGDIQTYISTPANLAVGADGKVVVADSTASTGLAYKGGMVQIAKVAATGSSSTITFSSIPANYIDLKVIFVARDTKATNSQSFAFQMNGDTTTANYVGGRYENVDSGGVTTGSLSTGTTGFIGVDFPAASTAANIFGQGEILFSNYTNTSIYKRASAWADAPSGAAEGLRRLSGYWKSTSAITSIVFTTNGTNFASGTVFTLYGIGTP